MGDTLKDLLDVKERNGLRLMLTIKLIFLCLMSLTFVMIDFTHIVLFFALFIFLIFLPINLFLLKKLKIKKSKKSISYFSLATDFILISVIPFMWYAGMMDRTTIYIVLKYGFFPIFALFIATNTITFNPKYPIIITSFAVLYQLVILPIGMNDSNITYTDDFLALFTTASVHVGSYITNIINTIAIGAITTGIAILARRSLKNAIELEKANSNLGRYFSPSVVEKIKSQEDFLDSTASHDIAIMFTDIRGFTSFSENSTPDEVITFLRDYHSRMVDIIFRNGGTVDKFLGDGILVTFGTPTPTKNDAGNAVKAAIEMHSELIQMNIERESEGKKTLQQGIGIHYGNAIVGNIGTKQKLEYTVIGDAVNVASRVESQCKALNENLLISQAVKKKLKKRYKFVEYKSIELKGKEEKINLYGLKELL